MKQEVRAQARAMRLQGISVNEIARILGISKSSASIWVRDIELTEDQIRHLKANQKRYEQQNKGAKANQARASALRLKYQQEGRLKARENRPLHQAGCLLYWAEGAKDRNEVYFVNSDVHMLRMFMRFLREEMQIRDEEISLYIHCHYPDPEQQRRIEVYWITMLDLEENCLRKTQVKKGSDTRKNILINGVCGIRVARSTRLAQHIYGAIQEYAGFEHPAWLF